MKQYEVRWVSLPHPIGRRPVLLLTRMSAYSYLNKVIVAEITSRARGIPQEVSLRVTEGLKASCVVNFDNVHVVPADALGDLIGVVARRRERELKRALGYALDWPELKVLS
jgi:mRNA interferase MazF